MESTNISEINKKVREYKHNYAENFGWVVMTPADNLFEELISHPESFTLDEKRNVTRAYIASIKCKSFYEGLGLSVEERLHRLKEDYIILIKENSKLYSTLVDDLIANLDSSIFWGKNDEIKTYVEYKTILGDSGLSTIEQLDKLRKEIIPLIKENSELYRDLISTHELFEDKLLISILGISLSGTEKLCSNLENILGYDYSDSKPFSLTKKIKEVFDCNNRRLSLQSKQTILIDEASNFVRYSNIMVRMNVDGFESYFIGNILNNLNEHAFNDFDNNSSQRDKKMLKKFIPLEKFLSKVFPLKIKEKRVRIMFKLEEDKPKMAVVTIENNGNAYKGSLNSVFEYGVGENGDGHGIGLYSAKKFIESYGGFIRMFTNPNDEYVVGFEFKIPVYE